MDSTERYRYGLPQPLSCRGANDQPYRTTRSATTSDQAIARFIDRLIARDNELVIENTALARENAQLVIALFKANKRMIRLRHRILILLYRLSRVRVQRPSVN